MACHTNASAVSVFFIWRTTWRKEIVLAALGWDTPAYGMGCSRFQKCSDHVGV